MKVTTPFHLDRDPGFSFLPEDYLERKAEQRTNIVSVTLFSIVLFAVVAAFFVTNQQWTAVKQRQQAINRRYMQAAQEIEALRKLESQTQEMFAKALITTALLEKTPRSVLLADLINRMPQRLALLEFNLTSKRIKPSPAAAAASAAKSRAAPGKPRTLAAAAAQGAPGGKQQPPPQPQPPRYQSTVELVGVAPTHNQVAEYVAQLQQSPLLQRVELKYSESAVVDDLEMIEFRIEAQLDPNADARRLGPVDAPTRDGFFNKEGVQAGVEDEEDPALQQPPSRRRPR
ncbi:MAG: hypothetical protein D6824_05275 [Planctomycetota bacterium]|nr:MAG: hypothetical protein D6824_05275 [Planctomycetota bacterium]